MWSAFRVSPVTPEAPAPWPSVSTIVTSAAPVAGTDGATAIAGSATTAAWVALKTVALVVACVVTKLL